MDISFDFKDLAQELKWAKDSLQQQVDKVDEFYQQVQSLGECESLLALSQEIENAIGEIDDAISSCSTLDS